MRSQRIAKDYSRQTDIFNPRASQPAIKIIGAGSVGSFITLALAKMGLEDIEIWDGDRVETHNLPNQFYRLQDLGEAKVKALLKIIKMYEGIDIKAHPVPFNGQDLKGIVISAVDSMDARRFVWGQIKGQRKISNYIDTRMGGNLMRIYSVQPRGECKFYESTLSKKNKLEELPCTGRTILYNVLAISGLVGNLVKKMIKKESGIPREIIFDLKLLELYKEGR